MSFFLSFFQSSKNSFAFKNTFAALPSNHPSIDLHQYSSAQLNSTRFNSVGLIIRPLPLPTTPIRPTRLNPSTNPFVIPQPLPPPCPSIPSFPQTPRPKHRPLIPQPPRPPRPFKIPPIDRIIRATAPANALRETCAGQRIEDRVSDAAGALAAAADGEFVEVGDWRSFFPEGN